MDQGTTESASASSGHPAAEDAALMRRPTDAQINSACLSYRHDFGLLSAKERVDIKFEALQWFFAWEKEGIGCDRDVVIEQCAAVVDQCNREGPYQAIAAAPRIRALKSKLSKDGQIT
ncbi:hypothetical protein [Bradyrhizobium sp. ORS 86]|uniref:hypothetical protein n=1 Tax=Bradyrhizobium sp. ORS 86 TaxID=1685970 RepID=UPI00388E1142